MNLLDDFRSILNVSITAEEIFANLIVALIGGSLISVLYRLTYKGPSYSVTFVNSMIFLSMITAVVIMVIGNNLARAFGLVGAMSIIRFRTAIKDTQDIAFVFFSLAIGMAAGVGFHKLALIGTIFIGITMYTLLGLNFVSHRRREFLLQFSYSPSDETEPSYLPIMEKYCRSHKLVNIKSFGEGDVLESSFYVYLKDKNDSPVFARELSAAKGVKDVNLFFDEEHF